MKDILKLKASKDTWDLRLYQQVSPEGDIIVHHDGTEQWGRKKIIEYQKLNFTIIINIYY
jgi:hypothetical protein